MTKQHHPKQSALTTVGGFANNAVLEYLQQCIVPILIEDESGIGIQGNGCLFRVNGRVYIVTAGHVLEHVEIDALAIPNRPGRPSATYQVPLTGSQVYMTNSGEDDVAVLCIEDRKAVRHLSDDWIILTPDDLVGGLDNVTWFIVAGFPNAKTFVSTDRLTGEFFATTTSRFRGQTNPPVDPDTDLVLCLAEETIDPSFNPGKTPHLAGISGSPIWIMPNRIQGSLWTPRSHVKVCAVEIAFVHSSYVRGTKWNAVVKLFRQFDLAAAEEIGTVLRNGTK